KPTTRSLAKRSGGSASWSSSATCHRRAISSPRRSAEEFDGASRQVVHCTGDLDRTLGFQIRKHRAVPSDVGDGQLDVLARHGIHERVVLRRTLAGVRGCLHRGFYLGLKAREVAKLGVFDGALVRTMIG